MTTAETGWRRDRPGLGVWPHQGKVAITGWGMSPVDRRWDGISMDRTLGEFCILAAKRALEDAGVKPEEVDGLLQCPNNMAGANGGSAASWGPYREYFPPPYDSEDGLTIVTGNWMRNNMPELTGVTYAPEALPDIGEGLGFAAQAVAEGKCEIALYIYTANNLEGRYRRGGDNASDYAQGPNQWTFPWGANNLSLQIDGTISIQQYCSRYGTTWEELMAPLILTEHRNGMMTSWGFYATNGASGLTDGGLPRLQAHRVAGPHLGLRQAGERGRSFRAYHRGARKGHAPQAGLRAEPQPGPRQRRQKQLPDP